MLFVVSVCVIHLKEKGGIWPNLDPRTDFFFCNEPPSSEKKKLFNFLSQHYIMASKFVGCAQVYLNKLIGNCLFIHDYA